MGRKPKAASTYSYVRENSGLALMPTGKNCSICGISRSYNDFHKLWRSADGRQPLCKQCKSIENARRCRVGVK